MKPNTRTAAVRLGCLAACAVGPALLSAQGAYAQDVTNQAGAPAASATDATSPSSQPASAAAVAGSASAAPPPSPLQQAETFAEGYALPDAPALSILNVNSSKVQEPGSLEQVGAQIMNSITATGGVESGLALNLTGRAFGIGYDYADYKSNAFARFFGRMALSIGTAQDSAVPTTILGALGLRIVIFDESDPFLDPNYDKYALNINTTCPPAFDPAGKEAHAACIKNATAQTKLKAPPWNASGLALAGATSEAFANGALSQGTWADSAGWLTGSVRIDPSDTFGLQLSGDFEVRHDDIHSKNIVAGGLRLRGGSAKVHGALEGDYASENPYDPDNRKGRLLVGLDVKLTTGTWLNANLGGDYNFSGSPFAVFSLATFKYAFASSPAVAGP